jgi:hypothetical protein
MPRLPISTGLLPAFSARSLGEAAVHGHLREFQADEVIIGLQADLPESLHHSKLDPRDAPSLRSVLLRAGCVGDPLVVGAAEDQDLQQLLEDDSLRDARAGASERMVGVVLGEQVFEPLSENGLDEVWWQRGHGCTPSSGSVENSPDDFSWNI